MPTWQDIAEITDVEMTLAGPPAAGVTASDFAVYDARMRAVEDRGLGDLADVTTAGAVDNQALVYKPGQTPPWRPGAVTGSIAGVHSNDSGAYEQVSTDTTGLYFSKGVKARQGSGGPQVAVVELDYDGLDATLTPARRIHQHTVLPDLRFPYAGTGTPLSSGQVTLVNQLIGGFAVGVPMAVSLRGYVHVQGVDDLARFTITLGIDGATSVSSVVGGPEPAYVAEWGVNGQWAWEFGTVITPAEGSALTRTVTMSVQRVSGSLDIISGFLVVERRPGR